MRELILVAIVLPCAVVALRRPAFGMLIFVWLGFFVPQSMTYGATPLSMLMAACTILGYFMSSEPKRFPAQREVILFLLIWALFGLTTVLAIYPDRAIKTLTFVSKIFLMVFFAMCIINTKERLHQLVRVIALSIGFYAAKGCVFVLLTRGHSIVYGPSGSFLEANNMIGLAFAMNLPLLAYLVKTEERNWLRWVCRIMFVSSFPAMVFTYSRGAWLGMVAVSLLMALRSPYRVRIATMAMAAALFVTPFAIHYIPERLANRYEDLENYEEESSAQMRFGSWTYCFRVAVDDPLTGGGFDHYSRQTYDKYAPEYNDRWGGELRYRRSSCHSIWFTVIGEHGFIGFLLWAGILGSFAMSVRRIRIVSVTRPEIVWMFDLAGALQFSLAGYAVVGTFIDAAYFDLLYYLIAIVVILKERLADNRVTAVLPEVDSLVERRLLGSAKRLFTR